MTKSTITREQLEEWVAQLDEDGGCDATDRQLEALIRQSLAEMDSEPVAEVVSIYGDPEAFGEREIRPLVGIQQMPYGTKLYRHVQQPVVESEPVVEVLSNRPGNDTSTIDRALPVGTQLYRHAQPEPVVPKSISVRQAISALESAGAVTTIGQAYKMGWNACRAAMLAAAPQSPGSEPATVPGKWIPVSERMPEREVDVQVYCPDKKEQMVAYLERNEQEGYFRFATWRTGDGIYCQPTHWMPLPAAPQEVK
ncbi:DUF551 domain-containing protein [Klebsiella quasipneumoniae]|uniref:DUF551 domain-containing protein n=1 Tax=Klebsiella quasipneumoniae TaxID=1463165 RepID=UPI001CA3D822|nr:DUF551 domain-containing protein [Klebsiella quasipneumoniae]MBY8385073.1 DUF551 domain-containing protein [Klebsiella quasipneumoniae]